MTAYETAFCTLQITNHTTSAIAVTCTPSFNGGLRQHFVMEVFETTANNTQVRGAATVARRAAEETGANAAETSYE